MAAPIAGVGYLLANDVLTWCAYSLIQPSVNTVVPAGGINIGAQTVLAYDPSMYVGAQVIVGVAGQNLEVVTITAVAVGASFSAVFTSIHATGEPILGATFPVRQPTDPLFQQAEMIAYLSTAINDFLTECPIIYGIATLTVPPTQQVAALPVDCINPVRMAYNSYPLRETSQSALDALVPLWTQSAASEPRTYFRDKVGLQNFGIWPKANNVTSIECVYAQRSAQTVGLGDGFLFPDPFVLAPFFRTLSFAYSKDGEFRSPGLAKYWDQRYRYEVNICNMFLSAISDPNLQMG